MDNPNSPIGSVFDRLLRGAIRGPDSRYRKHDIFAEAWDEAPDGENCMVSQLFRAVTHENTESRKRDASGNYVNSNPHAKAQIPKYTLEQWHTLTHDVELQLHPETLVLKEGVEFPKFKWTNCSGRGGWSANRICLQSWARLSTGFMTY